MYRTVAWIEPQPADPSQANRMPEGVRQSELVGTLRRTLDASIVQVVDATADSIPEDVSACVAVVAQLSEPELQQLLLRSWAHPVLWIVADAAQECVVLRRLGPGHDATLASNQVDTAIARLLRLPAVREGSASMVLADIDPLTGLMNRRSFGRLLRRTLDELLPGDHKALVHVDLDRFKEVNDRFGHAVGDRVLDEVSKVIVNATSQGDHVARIGGDEFALLVSRRDRSSIVHDARSLLHVISEQVKVVEAKGLVVRASAGLALLRRGVTEPQLYRQVDNAVYEAKSQGRNGLAHFELIHDDPDGGPEADLQRFQEVTRMFSDRMNRMVADVGRRLLESAQMHAQFDALTRARNRGFFNERLPVEIERARATDAPLAMAMLDVDHFHDVNVRFGWTSGDAVLRRFVQVASEQLRETDWLARYGGEEFVLVLPGAGLKEAEAVAERLRSKVEQTEFRSTDGQLVPVTISVGVTTLSDEISDEIAFCTKVGSACLLAKNAGRNRVVSIA
jgi:two-component system cell cycle response regulator